MAKVPLFAHCSKRDLARIGTLADEIDLAPGRTIMREGERGREFFVILEGEVDVRRDSRLLASLKTGDFLGEIALVAEVEEQAGRWDEICGLTDLVERAVDANLATPCVRNARTLLLCALASLCSGDERRALELERKAGELELEGHDFALVPVRLRLALLRRDGDELARLLLPEPQRSFVFGPSTIASRLDALAALRRPEAEAEAEPLLQPGTYLEPFALRALGIVREDETLVEQALERFRRLGVLPTDVPNAADRWSASE